MIYNPSVLEKTLSIKMFQHLKELDPRGALGMVISVCRLRPKRLIAN